MKHAPHDAAERIRKLREEIEELRYRYHVLNDPQVSDDVYTSLTQELQELEEQYPQLQNPNSPTRRVGGQPLEKFETRPHSSPMLSLNDVFSLEELEEWATRVEKLLGDGESPGYHMDLKMDGLATALIYEAGELHYGLTRGDGYRGEDITSNIRTIESIPLRLRRDPEIDSALYQDRVEIRGEVLIYKSDFQRLNAERSQRGESTYANPRNLAAGSVRQLDPKLAASRPLRFHAYRVLGDNTPDTLYEEYELARRLGFIVNDMHEVATSREEITRFINTWQHHGSKLDFHVDGAVVAVNDNAAFNKLGVVGKAPRGAVAYKYPAEQGTSTIQDIQVNVGRTGAVTPFAVLEPVALAGTTVQMATLHNEDEIRRKDIRIGDSVVVQKAGDIIPEIVESLPRLRNGSEQVFQMPSTCPECDTLLERPGGEAVTRCPNPDCPARVHRRIEHFVSKNAFDIDGLGERIVKTLLEEGLIEDAADLFTLRPEQLETVEGFGDKSARNTVDAIQARKTISLDRFIFGLGIRHIGQEAAFELARHFRSLHTLTEADADELKQVEGIGEVAAHSIVNWLANPSNQALLQKLHDRGVRPESVKQASEATLAGQTFVVTGTLETMSRDEAEAAIRERGGNATSSVSSNTTYVVVGENPGSNKLSQAQRYGVTQLNEEQFQQLLQV